MNEGMENRIGLNEGWTPERVAFTSRQLGIIIATGIGVGIFAAVMQLYYVSALIGMLLLAGLVAWQFESTLALYALIAFIPFGRTPDIAIGGSGVGKGLYVSEVMLAFLLAVWFLKYVWGNLPKHRVSSAFYAPAGLYLLFCLINVWHSYLYWDSNVSQRYQYSTVNFIELLLRFLSVGALIMMATSVRERKWLGWISLALMFAGAYNCFNAFFRLNIPISASWWILLLFLPAGYMTAVMLDGDKALLVRVAAVAVLVIFVYMAFVRHVSWVSGWLGLFVVIGAVSFLVNKKVFVALAAIGCIALAMSWSFVDVNVIAASEEEGDYDRFDLLRASVKYASTFPMGVGLGNYRTYNSFHYGEKWDTTTYTSAHGSYAQHLSETGFPGAILFIGILFLGFRWIYLNYRELPRGPSKTFLLAALGQMAGISVSAFIGDYIVPTYHNGGIFTFSTTIYSWLIWGIAIAHVRISREEALGSVDSNS